MSPIGRIFLVLNLFLSAAFLGWAANALSTVEDYKGQLNTARAEHETALADKDGEIASLQTEKNDLSESARRMREERDSVSADRDSKETQLADLKRDNGEMKGSLEAIRSTLDDYKTLIEQCGADKDRYLQLANEAKRERDAAVAEASDAGTSQRDAEEATNNAQARIADLESEVAALAQEVSRAEVFKAYMVATYGVNVNEVEAVPDIDGAVLGVRMDIGKGLVIINKGRESGVQPGYTFEIFRGGNYKGQVRVIDVEARQCSAIVYRLNDNQTLSQGDNATTRL